MLEHEFPVFNKGRKFTVRFTTLHPLVEVLDGRLNLRTNYPEKPEVNVYVHCDLVPTN